MSFIRTMGSFGDAMIACQALDSAGPRRHAQERLTSIDEKGSFVQSFKLKVLENIKGGMELECRPGGVGKKARTYSKHSSKSYASEVGATAVGMMHGHTITDGCPDLLGGGVVDVDWEDNQ